MKKLTDLSFWSKLKRCCLSGKASFFTRLQWSFRLTYNLLGTRLFKKYFHLFQTKS